MTTLRRIPRFAGRAGAVVAVLVAIASLVGVAASATYANETPSWRAQGMAQDWVDLIVAAPWLAIAAALTLRGSRRGALLLGGGLLYTAYSFVIYAFGVHFNALFLVYVAILGLSVYGLVDLARTLALEPLHVWFDVRAPRRLGGGLLIGFALIFAALWLAKIVPALVAGAPPPELAEVGLPTNPVHVLDLALVLPLLLITGRLLLAGHDSGCVLGAVVLGFSVVMDLAILAMAIALGQGAVVGGFAVVTIGFATVLALVLRSVR